jgi:hypothetical protein
MEHSQADYLENECKLRVVDISKPSKEKQEIVCLLCSSIFNATPSSKLMNYKTYGQKGCPSCTRKNKERDIKIKNLTTMKEKYELLSDVDEMSLSYKTVAKFKARSCGHEFETKYEYIVFNKINCPVCNKINLKSSKFVDKNGIIIKKQAFSHNTFLKMLKESSPNIDVSENNVYNGMYNPLFFKCSEGHEWSTQPRYLIYNNSGCPYCSNINRGKNPNNKVYIKSLKWLNYMQNILGHPIKSILTGEEVCVKLGNGKWVFADGYIEEKKIVLEFNGSAFHGDPAVYNPTDLCHPYKKESWQTAEYWYNQTKEKEQELINLGYTVISIWESEWDDMVESNPLLNETTEAIRLYQSKI